MQCSRSDARLTIFSSDDCFHLICLKPAMHQLQEVQDKDMPARPARPTSGSNCSFPLANLRFLKKPSFTLYSKAQLIQCSPLRTIPSTTAWEVLRRFCQSEVRTAGSVVLQPQLLSLPSLLGRKCLHACLHALDQYSLARYQPLQHPVSGRRGTVMDFVGARDCLGS